MRPESTSFIHASATCWASGPWIRKWSSASVHDPNLVGAWMLLQTASPLGDKRFRSRRLGMASKIIETYIETISTHTVWNVWIKLNQLHSPGNQVPSGCFLDCFASFCFHAVWVQQHRPGLEKPKWASMAVSQQGASLATLLVQVALGEMVGIMLAHACYIYSYIYIYIYVNVYIYIYIYYNYTIIYTPLYVWMSLIQFSWFTVWTWCSKLGRRLLKNRVQKLVT